MIRIMCQTILAHDFFIVIPFSAFAYTIIFAEISVLFDAFIQNAQRFQNASGKMSKSKKKRQKVIHIQKRVFSAKKDL